MITFKDIEIDDKPIIDGYLNTCYKTISELTFANMFIWRKPYQIKWAIVRECLVIHYHSKYDVGASFPIGKGDVFAAAEDVIADFKERYGKMTFYIYALDVLPKFMCHYGSRFRLKNTIDVNDYVYRQSDLANLPGKKYHQKRNHISAFKKQYEYTYNRITPDDLEDCMGLFKKWYAGRGDITDISDDLNAKIELFGNYEALEQVGGILRVDHEAVAVTVGEELSPKTMVTHVEFANTDYRGSFALINQEFARNECAPYEYINREEDMGIEGLRKAKHSYYPVMMMRKYRAELIRK